MLFNTIPSNSSGEKAMELHTYGQTRQTWPLVTYTPLHNLAPVTYTPLHNLAPVTYTPLHNLAPCHIHPITQFGPLLHTPHYTIWPLVTYTPLHKYEKSEILWVQIFLVSNFCEQKYLQWYKTFANTNFK